MLLFVFNSNLVASTAIDANGRKGVDVVLTALELNGRVRAVDTRHFDSGDGVHAHKGSCHAEHDCNTAQAVHLACIRAAVASQIGARRALQGHLRET